MNQRSANILLAVVLAFCTFLIWNLEPDATQPNVQFIPEMHYSIPLDPQSANALMADGKTEQPPPPGTIARGFMPIRYGMSDDERKRAGRELVSPVSPDSTAAMDRGTIVFATYCQPCHGPTGEGDGVVTRYGFPPPPSFGSPVITALRDGEIFHTLTFGKGNMPALTAQVSRADRWNVILRVRALQEHLQRRQQSTAAARPSGN